MGTVRDEWYRYEVSNYYDGSFSINLYRFTVLKKTLKGVWLKMPYGEKDKFVLNIARKRYAYPTIDLAWNSFRIRAFRRLEHLNNQHRFATRVNDAVKDMKEPPKLPVYRVGIQSPPLFEGLS
jgi:hypothetical protein